MNSAEGLKDEKTSIFNKVLQTSNQEKVVHKDLENKKAQIFISSCKSKQFNKHTKNRKKNSLWVLICTFPSTYIIHLRKSNKNTGKTILVTFNPISFPRLEKLPKILQGAWDQPESFTFSHREIRQQYKQGQPPQQHMLCNLSAW